MCATNPIAAWPHSPSRSSRSACALAGTRILPFQTFSAISRSADVAWLVSITGRVCGTAIGTAPSETVSRTRNASTTARTAAANASQCVSGSGPCISRYGVPRLSWLSRTTSRGAS